MINSTTADILSSFIPFFVLGVFFSVFNNISRAVFALIKCFFKFISKKGFFRKRERIRLLFSKLSAKLRFLRELLSSTAIFLYGLIYSCVSFFYLDGCIRLLPFFLMCAGVFFSNKIIYRFRKCVKFRHKKCV